jgi:hypothetical protein
MGSSIKKLALCIIIIGVVVPLVFVFADDQKPTPQEKYEEGKVIKVLIVPGHDDEFPGAKYRQLREADMTAAVARQLAGYLGEDPRFVVVVARDQDQYIPSLYNYFQEETEKINNFIKSHSLRMKKEIQAGTVIVPKQVPHGNAEKIPMYRLYAINKWATEQGFDIIVHLHFNDEGSRALFARGKFAGYAVYVPDSNLLGADISRDLGIAITKRLKRDFKPSNQPYEQARVTEDGVIPDMKLIALGANKTTAVPRVLIEYSYIYEPIVQPKQFPLTSDVMAAATVYGIQDFLKEVDPN